MQREHHLTGQRPEGDVDRLTIFSDGTSVKAFLAHWFVTGQGDTDRLEVLEAGCGQRWPISVEGVALRITGVDSDEAALRIRRETYGDLDVEICGDLRTVALPPKSFDIVYCSYVLEHVSGAESVLDRLVDALKPGGRLIIRIPDGLTVYGFLVRYSPHRIHIFYKRYVEGFQDAGKPGHAPYPTVYDQVVSRRGIHQYANTHGLRVVGEYGANTYLKNFGRAEPIVRWGVRLIALMSWGRLTATHSDIGLVIERPDEIETLA